MPKKAILQYPWLHQLIAILLLLSISTLEAQNLQGATQVTANSTHVYTFDNGALNFASWTVSGGTVINTTGPSKGSGTSVYTATVQWGVAGPGSVSFSSFGTPIETLNVAIAGSGTGVTLLSDRNYVYTLIPREATTDETQLSSEEKLESVTYFDGLGRAEQQVSISAGGNQQDLITHIDYDAYGRQDKEYLPYAFASNNGQFANNALSQTESFYDTPKYENTNNPYSEKAFEASPLNRVLKQAAPGNDWVMGGGHEIEMDYQSNINFEVKRYEVDLTFANNTYTPQLVLNGSYHQGELYKSVIKDENHDGSSSKAHTTEEFKDAEGRVILKRTYGTSKVNGITLTNAPHDTYYVYDIYGNLTYVLPPSAEPHESTPTTPILNELCYQYIYDHRNRLVEKKVPGKDWEYIVYNRLDQPVLTQDAHLRAQNRWLFTKYDAFGRVAYTGIMSSSSTRTTLQNTLNSLSTMSVNQQGSATTIAGTSIYYNNGAYPTSNIVELHTINYYDNYTFDKAGGNSETAYGVTPITNAKGLATGSKVRVLTTNPVQWITNVMYYDIKGRPIYTYTHNPYLATTDKVKSELGFDGRVTRVTTTHQKGLAPIITTEEIYEYDHQNRLETHKQSINGATNPEVIVSNQYDELGQLESKGVGGKATQSRLQTVDYSYNIRGWLKQINNPGNLGNDLFAMQIKYTNPIQAQGQDLFNGNIAEIDWKTQNDNVLYRYTYHYDALNRITKADFTGPSQWARYRLDNVQYDKNGNITNLRRNGHIVADPISTNSAHFGTMDNLTYTYQANSNKLIKVTDTGNTTYGFKDGTNQTIEYTYDTNGNMVKDLNKGIVGPSNSNGILYNHLNLPTEVRFGSVDKIKYIYDATGVKLSKQVIKSGQTDTYTYYAGNYIYEGSSLKFFSQPEGYVETNGSNFDYVYQYKDHLGNIRLNYKDISTTSTPILEIIEENNYYPFGLKHKGYNDVVSANVNSQASKYKYNGKELNDELGLNLYDYHARLFDPATARFTTMDPHAEKYARLTPYNYVYNNPVNAIDPNGKDGILIVFPDYKVDTESRFGKQPLGHAGVLLIDNKTGTTKYYEYGRYPTKDGTKGRVRRVTIPDVIIGEDGKPTAASLKKVMNAISKRSGQGGRIEAAYTKGDFKTMNDYAQAMLKRTNPGNEEYDKDRDPYDLFSNNCGTFACDVLNTDEINDALSPWIIIPTPDNMAEEYQDEFDSVSFNPETNTLKYTVNEKYYDKYLKLLKKQQEESKKEEQNDE